MKFRTGRCWNLIKVDYMYQHVFGGFKPPTEGWIRTAGRALLDRLLDVHRTNGTKNVWMWAVSLLLWMVRDVVVLLGKVMVPVVVVLSVPIQHTLGCCPSNLWKMLISILTSHPLSQQWTHGHVFETEKNAASKTPSKRMEDPKLLQMDLFLVMPFTTGAVRRVYLRLYLICNSPSLGRNIHKLGGAFGFNYVLFFSPPTPGKINMEPENTPLEKEKHLPNHHFQVLC